MDITFPTRRDRWLVAVIWMGAALAVVGGFAQLAAQSPTLLRTLVFLFLVGTAAFMFWILYQTEYVLESARLLVRCGPIRYEIPLGSRTLVQISLAAVGHRPALS